MCRLKTIRSFFFHWKKHKKNNGRKTISEKNDEKCYSSVGGVNTNTTRPYGEVKILLKFYYFSVNGNTQLQVPCCMFLLLVLLISCFLEFPFVDFSKKRRRRWWLNLCINSVFFPLRADQTFFYATCYFRKFVEEIKSKELQQKNSMTRLCDVIISVKHT